MIAVQYVFVRLGTQNGRISDLMYISLLCNVVITVPPALVWFDVSMSLEAVAFFAAAGLAGSLFGRICIFTSVNLIGANRTSPVVSGNALFATILAVVVLGETLTALHFVGVVMIVVGIVIVSYETAENTSKDYSRRRFAVLMAIPLLAALFISFEPIFISLGLENGGSVVPGIAIMVTAAWIGYTLYLVFDDDLPSRSLVREPYAKWYVGAGVATTIGFVAYFAAIELAPVAVVVPLI
ncbi:EamA family transporter, partial [Natronococcus sp.]|uniref:EamA family transporter n=1 Tax=Natronococcus sp. TaxID=35747 RepID=UPI003A4D6AF8